MSDGSRRTLPDTKSYIILVLLLALALQTVFLTVRSEPEPEPEPAAPEVVRLIDVTVDRATRGSVQATFDAPVGDPQGPPMQGEESPVSLTPDVNGEWYWATPYVLRLRVYGSLRDATRYTLKVRPDVLAGPDMTFAGETETAFVTGDFVLEQMTLEPGPRYSDPADKTRVGGVVRFNAPVRPVEVADRLTLTDLSSNATVPVFIQTTYDSTEIRYDSGLLDKAGPPRPLELRLAPGVQARDGGGVIAQPYTTRMTLTWDPVLRLEKAWGRGNDGAEIVLAFSAPVGEEPLRSHLTLTPEVDYSVHTQGTQVVLSGPFPPGERVSLRVAKGLTALDRSELTAPREVDVAIPDLQPAVSFEHRGMFLSRKGFRSLALKTVNTSSVDVVVDRVFPNTMIPMLTLNYYDTLDGYGWKGDITHAFGGRIADTQVQVDGAYNTPHITRLDLSELIGAGERGVFRVVATLPGEYSGAQRWVLLTDMGLVAKRGGDDILVCATSFSTLQAVVGARITILDDQQQTLAEGVTDALGVFHAKGLAAALQERRPHLVVAEKGDDVSLLLFGDSRTDMTGLDVAGLEESTAGYTAYLYGERDIYRPGETVQSMALVRDRALEPVGPLAMLLKVQGPKGGEVGRHPVQVDAAGRAAFALDISPYALTGQYTATLLAGDEPVGEYRYHVEEFVPDRIKVEISRPGRPQQLAPGDMFEFAVASRYFFGPPAAGMAVETRVRLAEAPFAPEQFSGYVFGDPERSFDDRIIWESSETLDAEGTQRYEVQLPEGLHPPAALNAVVTTRVREKGGRGVAAQDVATVHPYARYVGLKQLEKQGYERGAEISFDYALVTPAGAPADPAGVSLRADLVQDRWQTVLRRDPAGGWRYESVRDSVVAASKNLDADSARGDFSFTPRDYGAYRVVLTEVASGSADAVGAATQVSFYVGGWGYSPWAVENPARLELVPDREGYGPDGEAVLQVRAPFPGRLLVTVERESVRAVQAYDMASNTGTVRIPLEQGYAPNVYVTAVLVRKAADVEPGEPGRAVGAVSLSVDREANRLQPAIAAPARVRPEEEVAVTVRTAPGASVTIAAVDEGVLQLINQDTPDPFGHFYAKRALGVDTFDIYSMLLPEVGPSAEGPAGGDGGMQQFVRTAGLRRVQPVAFWSGPLTADAAGEVEWSFTPPDFQGALRLMAVAADGRRFGAADEHVVVKSPVVALPTFPRFLAPEESATIPVTVRNDTESAGEFTVSFTASGAARAESGETVVQLAASAEETVYFSLSTTEATGPVLCKVAVEGAGERYTTSTELDVRPVLPARTLVRSGALDSSEAVFSPEGEAFRPDTLRRSLRIGATPLVRFSESLEELVTYPYGCLEQTVSQAFPLLRFDTLAAVLDPEALSRLLPGAGAAAFVQQAIGRVRSMQLSSGGFAYWPEGTVESEWPSIYALHFLAEARDAGFGLGAGLLEPAVQYVTELARYLNTDNPAALKQKCYALYALAVAGAPERGAMDVLRDDYAAKLSAEGRALLAAAYGRVGDVQSVRGLLGPALEPSVHTRETGGSFSSPIRERAMLLLALQDAVPGDARVADLAAELVRRLEAVPRLNTQEAGVGFLALSRYYGAMALGGTFSGRVLLDGDELAVFTSDQPLWLTNIESGGDLRVAMDPGYEPGTAFFNLAERGIPPRERYEPAAEGLEVSMALSRRDGAPVDGSVSQGDLLVASVSARSLAGPVQNVAVTMLLPAGFEVENPRLATSEQLPVDAGGAWALGYLDVRDDRALLFGDLPDGEWRTHQVLLRAVTPGEFALPPVQVEAMYDPQLRASGRLGTIAVLQR